MPRRSRSRSRSRKGYGKNGLPLRSTLRRSDIGKVMEDNKGNLKQVSDKLYWEQAEIDELSKSKSDKYYNKIERNLDDEDAIRDILVDVLEDVQPKVVKRL